MDYQDFLTCTSVSMTRLAATGWDTSMAGTTGRILRLAAYSGTNVGA